MLLHVCVSVYIVRSQLPSVATPSLFRDCHTAYCTVYTLSVYLGWRYAIDRDSKIEKVSCIIIISSRFADCLAKKGDSSDCEPPWLIHRWCAGQAVAYSLLMRANKLETALSRDRLIYSFSGPTGKGVFMWEDIIIYKLTFFLSLLLS